MAKGYVYQEGSLKEAAEEECEEADTRPARAGTATLVDMGDDNDDDDGDDDDDDDDDDDNEKGKVAAEVDTEEEPIVTKRTGKEAKNKPTAPAAAPVAAPDKSAKPKKRGRGK